MEFLALLASSAGPVSRDRIGETLWDHLEPSEWPNNIKVTLSRIRSKVGVRDAVVHAHGGYRLSPVLDVDIVGAEALLRTCRTDGIDETRRARLREVVDAYRSGSAARYERFPAMFPGLARVNDVACTAGLLLAAHDLGQGRYDDAIGHARGVSEIDPFDEGACEITFKALLARGEADAARREFQRYAKTLAEGLGAKPSANLIALASATLTAR
jgi:DNA-binding SARP family transcriptional activator